MSDVRTAKKLISVVELVGVRLIEIRASNRLSTLQEKPPVTIEHTQKASVSAGDEAGRFVVFASIDVRINATDGENQPLVRIRAKVELRYKVPPSFPVLKKELNAFARVNAVYNAWPYFREIVQSVSGRMELPQMILPVYRIRPPKPRTQALSTTATPEANEVQGSEVASTVTN
jgi:hypothetical protein